ncbi:hypothetical protein MMJJ_06930 [Methanococcus maripaludis]|uniref:Uncharacterized protein n=1 Tax=Methanococcus maripaludis TaxID=39152 RepID=A0A2L1C9R6_METMI|nr:hypothetical protein MMJJ_06930 [Methanococcus maripaludis]
MTKKTTLIIRKNKKIGTVTRTNKETIVKYNKKK